MRYSRCLATIAVIVAVFLVCGGVYYVVARAIHVSLISEMEAHFETLPPDDRALKQWLLTQPGVVSHRAWVSRFGLDKKVVAVLFIQVRNGLGEPPLPDLDAACARLGYQTPDGPFRLVHNLDRAFTDEP